MGSIGRFERPQPQVLDDQPAPPAEPAACGVGGIGIADQQFQIGGETTLRVVRLDAQHNRVLERGVAFIPGQELVECVGHGCGAALGGAGRILSHRRPRSARRFNGCSRPATPV